MAEVEINKVYGVLRSNTGTIFAIRTVYNTDLVFAMPVVVDDPNFTIDHTIEGQIGEVIEVSYVGEYHAGIVATSAKLTGALDLTETTPEIYIGEVVDIAEPEEGAEGIAYTLSILTSSGNSIVVDVNTTGVAYPEAQPYITAPIQLMLEAGVVTYILVPQTYVNAGNNQVISNVHKLSDADLPPEKQDGEYVYPVDWNAVVTAIKTLNANAVALAEVIQQHNALDNDTMQVASKAITDASVLSQHIKDGAVTTLKIADKAITKNKIVEQCVQTEHIAPGVFGALLSGQLKEVGYFEKTAGADVTTTWYNEFDLGANYNTVILTFSGPGDVSLAKSTIILTKAAPTTCWIFGHVYDNSDYTPVCGPFSCDVQDTKVITPLQTYGYFSGLSSEQYYPLLFKIFGHWSVGLTACHLKETAEGNTSVCLHLGRFKVVEDDEYKEMSIRMHVYAL